MITDEALAKLLDNGWKIRPTRCGCGGNWAWLKPRLSGAMEMYGCVCHNTGDAYEYLSVQLGPETILEEDKQLDIHAFDDIFLYPAKHSASEKVRILLCILEGRQIPIKDMRFDHIGDTIVKLSNGKYHSMTRTLNDVPPSIVEGTTIVSFIMVD